eukprot:2604670-Rhodomonas_salina.1
MIRTDTSRCYREHRCRTWEDCDTVPSPLAVSERQCRHAHGFNVGITCISYTPKSGTINPDSAPGRQEGCDGLRHRVFAVLHHSPRGRIPSIAFIAVLSKQTDRRTPQVRTDVSEPSLPTRIEGGPVRLPRYLGFVFAWFTTINDGDRSPWLEVKKARTLASAAHLQVAAVVWALVAMPHIPTHRRPHRAAKENEIESQTGEAWATILDACSG